jgi:folate-dependent phosphoribosylglycinamide formyltransferase PurN
MDRIGWFSTGRDPAARDLLTAAHDAMRSGGVNAQIDFVFLSRAPGESRESDRFIELVKSYGLPLVCFSYQQFKSGRSDAGCQGFPSWRLQYDREVMARLEAFRPDLCVLAGYMLIVGPEMCGAYKMINLHPAAPGGPTGTWQEVIRQLIENRASETGVMMHLVTPELDRGPVVTFCTFPLRGKLFDGYWKTAGSPGKDPEGSAQKDLFCLIREEGFKREFPLIIRTIKSFSEGRVRVEGGRVIDSLGQTIPGYNLTGEIDKLLSG